MVGLGEVKGAHALYHSTYISLSQTHARASAHNTHADLGHELAEGEYNKSARKARLNYRSVEPARDATFRQLRVGCELRAQKHHEDDEELAPH